MDSVEDARGRGKYCPWKRDEREEGGDEDWGYFQIWRAEHLTPNLWSEVKLSVLTVEEGELAVRRAAFLVVGRFGQSCQNAFRAMQACLARQPRTLFCARDQVPPATVRTPEGLSMQKLRRRISVPASPRKRPKGSGYLPIGGRRSTNGLSKGKREGRGCAVWVNRRLRRIFATLP